jgi:hypothetical protein
MFLSYTPPWRYADFGAKEVGVADEGFALEVG